MPTPVNSQLSYLLQVQKTSGQCLSSRPLLLRKTHTAVLAASLLLCTESCYNLQRQHSGLKQLLFFKLFIYLFIYFCNCLFLFRSSFSILLFFPLIFVSIPLYFYHIGVHWRVILNGILFLCESFRLNLSSSLWGQIAVYCEYGNENSG